MKMNARDWPRAATLMSEHAFYRMPERGPWRRFVRWGRAIRRHASTLWFVASLIILSLTWVKACTSTPVHTRSAVRHPAGGYARTNVGRAMASALWQRHRADDSIR
jgi:hypothetical protein